MKARSDPALVEQFRKASVWIGIILGTIGLFAVAGWLLNVPLLRGTLPGLTDIKFNSALCIVFLGAGLVLLPRNSTTAIVTQVLAVLVILSGAITLLEYAVNWNPGFDNWLVQDPDNSTAYPGRMSLLGAAAFMAQGGSLFLQARNIQFKLAHGLVMLSGTLSLIAVMGFLYGIERDIPFSVYHATALTSWITRGLLSTGLLLANTGSGLVTILSSPGAGGILARRIVPFTIVAPMLFAWVHLQGERLGYYEHHYGLALASVSTVVTGGLLVGWIARRLRRVDTERETALEHLSEARDELEFRVTERTARLVQSNTALLHSERRLSGILNTTLDAIISVDDHQNILLFNQGAEQIFGYSSHEVIGKPLDMLIPERFREAHRHYIRRFGEMNLAAGLSARVRSEVFGVRKGGKEFPAEASIAKLDLYRERIFTVILRDITERHEAQMKIQELTTGLENRVTERTQQLADANAQLQELDSLKNQFVDNISHELRTPLTSIKLLHNLLGKDSSKNQKYLGSLVRETSRLQYLIESLLLISRLDTTISYQMTLEPIDLGELAEELVHDRHRLAEELGLTLAYRAGGTLSPVTADRQLMTQALSALLTNALNYTPSGGEVLVSTNAAPKLRRMGVQVADTGPGISPTDMPYLFDRFFRGATAATMAIPGTGVGLSIAKQILELHDGLLEVKNQGLRNGPGATFTAWLPDKSKSN